MRNVKASLFVYRIVYAVPLLLILVNVLRSSSLEKASKLEITLLGFFIVMLALGIFTAVALPRISLSLVVFIAVSLCGLFAWYGWYSVAAPFVLHELHTFDPVEAAAEIRQHRISSCLGYSVFALWLMALPLVRHFLGRLSRLPVNSGSR